MLNIWLATFLWKYLSLWLNLYVVVVSASFEILECCYLPVLILTRLFSQGSQWDDFIRLLCECLRLAVIYSCPIADSAIGFGSLDLHFLGSDVLKCKLEKANWSTVSEIFRVLRNILKRLSREENEELLDVYLESVNSTLAKVPWSRVDTIFSHQHCSGHNGILGSTANSKEATVFLGNFVQFLCSLVQQVRFAEDSDGFEPIHMILQKTIELVPDFFRWCQPQLESQSGSCMSRYLGHKLLVLYFVCLELHCFVSRYISDSKFILGYCLPLCCRC